MKIQEIVEKEIEKNKAEGLVNVRTGCHCELPNIFECGECPGDCELSYCWECAQCRAAHDGCEKYEPGNHCYQPEKQLKGHY